MIIGTIHLAGAELVATLATLGLELSREKDEARALTIAREIARLVMQREHGAPAAVAASFEPQGANGSFYESCLETANQQ